MIDNHILLLLPHPGRVWAEVYGRPSGLHSLGGESLQVAVRHTPRLLLDEGSEPTAAETLGSAGIRLTHRVEEPIDESSHARP